MTFEQIRELVRIGEGKRRLPVRVDLLARLLAVAETADSVTVSGLPVHWERLDKALDELRTL